jgi:hypothetical protein
MGVGMLWAECNYLAEAVWPSSGGRVASPLAIIGQLTRAARGGGGVTTWHKIWELGLLQLPYVVGSQRWDLNPRPAVYETAALPLSYAGVFAAYL